MGPDAGVTVEMVGTPTYVKPPVLAAEPPAVVTTTFFAPEASAGVTAVIDVDEFTVYEAAATPPKVTDDTTAESIKPVPVIVTDVPPPVPPAPV